jgi:integrase
LRAEGKSIATANYYLVAVKGFTHWLWRNKRTAVDPLAGMSRLAHADTEVRHARRDFTPDEMCWLLEAVRDGNRTYRGLTGLDRFTLYLTAAGTGFRVAELATLEPASFVLSSNMPKVRCQAAYSKNRKQVDQPLPPDVAQFLRDYLPSKPAEGPLWPGCWKDDAAEMIRQDMGDPARNGLRPSRMPRNARKPSKATS